MTGVLASGQLKHLFRAAANAAYQTFKVLPSTYVVPAQLTDLSQCLLPREI